MLFVLFVAFDGFNIGVALVFEHANNNEIKILWGLDGTIDNCILFSCMRFHAFTQKTLVLC